jgi:hypothetical protein
MSDCVEKLWLQRFMGDEPPFDDVMLVTFMRDA